MRVFPGGEKDLPNFCLPVKNGGTHYAWRLERYGTSSSDMHYRIHVSPALRGLTAFAVNALGIASDDRVIE